MLACLTPQRTPLGYAGFFAASNGLDPVLDHVGVPLPNQFSTPYTRPWQQRVQRRTPLCFGQHVASPFSVFREFTARLSIAPARQLCLADVEILAGSPPPAVRLRIKASKTDPLAVGCFVYVGRSSRTVCPVHAVLAYLTHRGSDPGPFFR